jgi:uncharacterized membrane protein
VPGTGDPSHPLEQAVFRALGGTCPSRVSADFVVGLRSGSARARVAGLALAGTLVKIVAFDLARLDSVARAASFLAVGAVFLLAGFFTQRLAAQREAEPNGA